MESGERLAPPPSSSLPRASSPGRSAPARPQTPSECGLAPPIPTCGHLFRMADQHFNMSGVSSAFPLVSHPAFGLFSTAGSARSEFGGLGTLGLSQSSGPHLGAFPDWWGASEAHGPNAAAAAALFHPLLALPPLFPSPFQNHHAAHFQVQPGRSTATAAKAAKRTMNGSSVSSSPAGDSATYRAPVHTKKPLEKTRTNNNGSSSSSQAAHQATQKDLDQKFNRKPPESSSISGSQSGSSSDCSSDGGECSSDLDDEDDDEEDGEPSSDSDDSEDGRGNLKPPTPVLTPAAVENKRKRASEGEEARDRKRSSSSFLPQSPPLATSGLLYSPKTREEGEQEGAMLHTSVIQATGLAAGHKPPAVPQPHREASTVPSRPSSKPPRALPSSPPSSSPKTLSYPSSPTPHSVTSSPAPLPLCSSPKPLSLCSSPKPPTLSPSHRPRTLTPSPKHTQLPEHPRVGSRAVLSEASLHAFKVQQPFLPQDPFKPALSPHRDSNKSLRTCRSSLPPPTRPCQEPRPSRRKNHTNLFLSQQSNGVAQAAPLALVTRPRATDFFPLPVNLSTKRPSLGSSSLGSSSAAPEASTSSAAAAGPRKSSAATALLTARSFSKTGLSVPMDTAVRSAESDITSSKDSDDSMGEDDDDEDNDDEDSDGSLSESDSNLESDSDDSKEREGTETERPPPTLTKTLFSPSNSSASSSSMGLSASFAPLNLQLIKPQGLLRRENPAAAPPTGALVYSSPPSSSRPPGPGKRRRVTDEQVLREPLQFGWQRETRIQAVGGRLQGEVSYYAPCGKKLRQYPDVMKYLSRNSITEITRDNFSFSTKMKVGDFYEVKEGPKGLQWFLLKEEQIAPCIVAMDGRRSRQSRSDPPPGSQQGAMGREGLPPGENNIHDANGVKLLRKLEAQEIARQATQVKLMRKLEKQAKARAAKEARRQQAIMAAEERRKKKEEMKIQKQQEKMKRVQQIRVEKELRAQHILEERRKRKAEAANAKVLEAEKRCKEKELRRQQAVLLKHQELERHRLDMVRERERRRQHLMLMKALEARKKVEERERLKQEKKDEKRLNKERKLELKRLELEMAKELKKPNEDLCLADHKNLPEFSRIPGLLLPGGAFSDCLMVMQFLHSFGRVLLLDMPTLSVLQEGLLNVGGSMGTVHALLVSLLSAAMRDPGLPPGHRSKTALGETLCSVTLTGDNVSEVLQIFMEAHGEPLALSLKTKAFQAHTPAHKASMLAFLVNELCCSKAVVSEIDKTIDHMTNMRKDKWVVEGKLRKLRSVHAKRSGKKECMLGAEDGQTAGVLAVGPKRGRREGDSEEEEEDEEEDDSEDQGDEEEDEEEESRGGGGKKGKKAELCEEEDDSHQTASVEELEKQIEKLSKQQSQIRRKLFDSSHSLRCMPYGQDRYRRRYWLLPPCGGLFLEGMESGEGCEELDKERQRRMSTQRLKVKEEQQEIEEEKEEESSPAPDVPGASPDSLQDPLNLFLQKPSSFCKLSTLLEVARMCPGADPGPRGASPPATSPCGPPLGGAGRPDALGLQAEQLFRALTERSGQWFSLLPRSPCNDSSVTSNSPQDASPRSPPCPSPQPPPPHPPLPASHGDPPGFSSLQLPALQSGVPHMGLPFFRPFGPLPPMLALAYQQQYEASGTTNPFLGHAPPAKTPAQPAKPPDTPSPSPKTQDYPEPRPIPEDMMQGWWRLCDMGELQGVVAALHSRGVREKSLQKQIQKHMEYMTLACNRTRDVVLDVSGLGQQQVDSWCEEQEAMLVDISLLQQVEALERKVTSGSLQVKGWTPGEAQSERGDLVYHEHKPGGDVVRRPDNPLDIAVSRLAELQVNIERSGEEEVAPGMRLWRRALGEVRSSAQLSLCIQQLQRTTAWDRSVIKACCQLCGRGDHEDRLLLCDGCDQGCHTYCLRPRISSVPEGDWFCPACLAKASSQTPLDRTQQSGTRASEPRRNRRWAAAAGEISEDEATSPASSSISSSTSVSTVCSSSPRKGRKESRKRRAEESSLAGSQQDSPTSWGKKAKTVKDNVTKDLAICRVLLGELESQPDAWPFLLPVNQKTVPGYRTVIKRPMDFSTIREKLNATQFLNLETFLEEVNLVFANCERFNEDDSEIGRAGHRMRRFFDRRWTELLLETSAPPPGGDTKETYG